MLPPRWALKVSIDSNTSAKRPESLRSPMALHVKKPPSMGSFSIAAALVLASLPVDRVDARHSFDTVTVGAHGILTTFEASTSTGWQLAAEVEQQVSTLTERGLDGVLLERRLADPSFSANTRRDQLTRQVRLAAENHGRAFHVAWDVRGLSDADWAARVKEDLASVRVFESPAYVRDGGRPVVLLRGLGASDAPGTVAETMDLIDWLKDRGCSVVAAVPSGWSTGEGTRPNFLSAFARVDAVQVEAGTIDEAVRADVAFAAQLGLAYQLVLDAPAPTETPDGPSTASAQRFWSQAVVALHAGVPVLIAGLPAPSSTEPGNTLLLAAAAAHMLHTREVAPLPALLATAAPLDATESR